ncbi:MAG: hypothetical protein JO108_16300 [Acidobacteriaceae bacterium]|nr:hypothetical protein [Acidobacteriaceae bacterium]
MSNVNATFSVQDLLAGRTITVLFENRSITSVAGGFADSFTGASRHVYMISNYMAGNVSPVLNLQIVTKTGPDAKRDWQFLISNTGTGAAQSTQISKVAISHASGKACTSTVALGALPLSFGDIAAAGSATKDLLINFSGCNSTSKFNVSITVTANGGFLKTFAFSRVTK